MSSDDTILQLAGPWTLANLIVDLRDYGCDAGIERQIERRALQYLRDIVGDDEANELIAKFSPQGRPMQEM